MKKKNPNKLLGILSPTTNELLSNDVETLQKNFVNHLEFSQAKDKFSATKYDYFECLVYTLRDRLFERWIETQQAYYRKDVKRVYYISMEYMMGRLLCNAILNLGIKNTISQALWELGLDLEELHNLEYDAGLGNGGLGRLAACFLDSMATLQYPAYGYGIRYEYGIFSQKIQDGFQIETADPWLRYGNPWEIERREFNYCVKFYGRVENTKDGKGNTVSKWVDTDDIYAVGYDTPIPGYRNNTVNNLRLWSAKASREFNLEYFNHGDYDRALEEKIQSEVVSKVLYPRDDFIEGRELRLKQEYFLVSATLQDIIRRYKKAHKNFKDFPDKVAIQLNDTHPALCIPELMRLLIDQENMTWNDAWKICNKTFAYTNHTILQEALETWRTNLMESLLPRHLQIIYEINQRLLTTIQKKYPKDVNRLQRMSLIEEGDERKVRMAHLAITGSYSVNGVAKLHTEILKTKVFKDFYDIWPERFNNKTNGITPRRWLKLANPGLSDLITEVIGENWITDLAELKKLEKYMNDKSFQERWQKVKEARKQHLAACISYHLKCKIDPQSMYDCQIKRIHEYKRQLLNLLYVITVYNRILEKSYTPAGPRTFIFSGKAAPGYMVAKLIIKLINSVADVVNHETKTNKLIKLIFIPDYSVSMAELIIPAAELSEQISTAGMEASGTGNMKFSLNGAVTIGTLDGANVEIREEVGEDNIFIFGLTAEQVLKKRDGGYNPSLIYEKDSELKQALDQIKNGYFCKSQPDLFKPLIEPLLKQDYYMLLADYRSYIEMQEKVADAYKDKIKWAVKSIMNSANCGRFSSDRTIKEYAENIWKVKPLPIKLQQVDQ
ncbi:MAG: glycogen/starch/alpha-glucan phosphorylase [Calditrichaeota bacterium]|nr:MAG: glycogen/starch/alpha-glucan phosphorylase [Calditrichota bacterium]